MIYKWTVPVYLVDAQTAGTELAKIAEKHGSLKPSYVVEESRDTAATLHNCFEWNDKRAAEKHRERQAQDIIRNLVTVKIGQVDTSKPIRAFISFKQEHEYVSVARVMQIPELRENMLEAAMKELEAFHRKYATLDALSELMSNIEQRIQKYKKRKKEGEK